MSYRDPVEALQSRRERIAADLAEARRAAEKVLESARRVGDLEKELAQADKLLASGGPRRSLPMLDQVRVASPCSASWDDMRGDDRVRHCAQCDKDVYDLSAMSREEAEAFVADHEGGACVRFYRRVDGTVLTSDCPVGVRRRRRRKAVMASVGGGLVAAALSYAAEAPQPSQGLVYMGGLHAQPRVERQIMGEMVAVPQPDPTPKPAPAPGTIGAPAGAEARPSHPAGRW